MPSKIIFYIFSSLLRDCKTDSKGTEELQNWSNITAKACILVQCDNYLHAQNEVLHTKAYYSINHIQVSQQP